MTHEDSVMSNGDGRSYSVRCNSGVHMYRLHRSGTSIVRNNNIHSGITPHRSTRVSRTLSPAPCVY